MTPEIRQAGCNPTRSSGIGIKQATRSVFWFTSDVGGDPIDPNRADGDTNDDTEDITFGMSAANDANGNGIADGGGVDWSTTVSLGRNTGGGFQPVAENIEAVEFNYILEGGGASREPANLNDIRAVQVSILGRAANPSKDFRHNQTYTTASGAPWTPPQDSFRRRLVIVNIQCRNLGL
jgi:type IV pilus assembly protein PilW